MNLNDRALAFATKMHEGQFRKDGVTPYIVHPIAVAEELRRIYPGVETGNRHMLAAAYTHDVFEDCEATPDDYLKEFGEEDGWGIFKIVFWLTNPDKFNKPKYGKRRTRKTITAELVKYAPWQAKAIKLSDRLCNLRDLDTSFEDPKFKRKYIRESRELFDAIWPELSDRGEIEADDAYKEAMRILNETEEKLK